MAWWVIALEMAAFAALFTTIIFTCYGNLPGLEFKRTGTLGTGADRCDFYLRKQP